MDQSETEQIKLLSGITATSWLSVLLSIIGIFFYGREKTADKKNDRIITGILIVLTLLTITSFVLSMKYGGNALIYSSGFATLGIVMVLIVFLFFRSRINRNNMEIVGWYLILILFTGMLSSFTLYSIKNPTPTKNLDIKIGKKNE